MSYVNQNSAGCYGCPGGCNLSGFGAMTAEQAQQAGQAAGAALDFLQKMGRFENVCPGGGSQGPGAFNTCWTLFPRKMKTYWGASTKAEALRKAEKVFGTGRTGGSGSRTGTGGRTGSQSKPGPLTRTKPKSGARSTQPSSAKPVPVASGINPTYLAAGIGAAALLGFMFLRK